MSMNINNIYYTQLVRIMINLPGNVTTWRSLRDFRLGNSILINPDDIIIHVHNN